jgi:K+-sensing histidine kinase KdpD
LAKIQEVLVCVDGSESSIKAANYAILMAEEHKMQLIALYVVVFQLGYAYSAETFAGMESFVTM